MDLSIVIPAYNEVESIPELHRRITAVLERMDPRPSYEIVFVDDGSTDGTSEVLTTLAGQDGHCRAIRLTANSGKSAAYMAGFEITTGEVVATLDAELQDDPDELPKLLTQLEKGADLVVGWKSGRMQNEPTKTVPSRLYNGLKGLLFGLNLRDSNCGFRVMRSKVAKSLVLYGGQYRLLPELVHLGGFRVEEMPVNHRPRKHGTSKYGISRFWTGLLDLFAVRFLTAYLNQPLHFFGTLAILPLALGLSLEIYVLFMKAAGSTFQTHIAAILTGLALVIVAVQILGIGLLGEMVRSFAGPHRARTESLDP